jgi:hypothetical protein
MAGEGGSGGRQLIALLQLPVKLSPCPKQFVFFTKTHVTKSNKLAAS